MRAITMLQDRAKATRSLRLGSPTLTGVLSFNYYFFNYCEPGDIKVFIRQRLRVKYKQFSQIKRYFSWVSNSWGNREFEFLWKQRKLCSLKELLFSKQLWRIYLVSHTHTTLYCEPSAYSSIYGHQSTQYFESLDSFYPSRFNMK